MQQWKKSGARHRKEGHGLGEPVDRRAPFLGHQQEDRRDESARVTNSNPPNKIHNRESPGDRNIHAPNANAAIKQVGNGCKKEHQQTKRDDNADPPTLGRWPR